jgi:hypothetical protein
LRPAKVSRFDIAPWLAVAAFGVYHGLNPAMGWLFAVALGLHRKSRTVVVVSLAPILVGHALAIGIVLYLAVALGVFIDERSLSRAAGLLLICWAAWHILYGHRHRVRVGMQTGFVGLGFWSLLMATAHGAGLMLLPVALPLCLGGPESELTASGSLVVGLAVIGVHTGAMLLVIAAIAILVYEWVGLAFLRRGWINLDLLWSVALAASGIYMLIA